MKKILKTSISIVLTLAICLSMFCGMTFSTVYAAESVDKGENILAGLMPVANYMTTTNGNNTYVMIANISESEQQIDARGFDMVTGEKVSQFTLMPMKAVLLKVEK